MIEIKGQSKEAKEKQSIRQKMQNQIYQQKMININILNLSVIKDSQIGYYNKIWFTRDVFVKEK